MHRYSDYSWLRGFSVVPSWGARIEQAWWDYEPERFREEIALATIVHANCLRLWIEFPAWMADPESVTASFLDAVAAVGELGMTAMPCLFNRWHDYDFDYGGTYTEDLYRNQAPKLEYVRALVEPLRDDPNVLVWDLCNEPQAFNLDSEVNQKEYQWLEQVAATVRECGVRQPITIGTMVGSNIEVYEPLMDVLCAHPYKHTPRELEAEIGFYDQLRAKYGKPLLVNETIPGCLDDLRRAEVARFYTEMLAEAGCGWMGWALREGKAISTRRDRHDRNGLDGEGFHPYFTAAGKLRGGLEFLTEAPARRAPWLER
ncbi:MAG: cellulase family glycosylhydrolase [Armatimonadia bacterium]